MNTTNNDACREALLAKVQVNDAGCWVWTASLANEGYGRINFGSRRHMAHRLSYQAWRGEIPEGMQIDHLCRNRACINPDHLEVVSQQENLRRGFSPSAVNARKSHCKIGHEFTEENTRRDTKGKRHCRTCDRQRWHKRSKESAHADA